MLVLMLQWNKMPKRRLYMKLQKYAVLLAEYAYYNRNIVTTVFVLKPKNEHCRRALKICLTQMQRCGSVKILGCGEFKGSFDLNMLRMLGYAHL